MSPDAIHSTALRSNSGSGPCGPNWRGPPSSSDRCPVPITATRWSRRPGLDQLAGSCARAGRTASAAAAAARRCWCRSARSAGRPAGRSVMIGHVIEWSIRSSLEKARSNPASRPSRRTYADRSSCALQQHPRQPELALLVVPVGVVERRLARPGTAACCPATAGGSGRSRPSPARRAAPRSASPGTPRPCAPTRRRTAAGPRRWRCWRGSRRGGGWTRSPRPAQPRGPPGRSGRRVGLDGPVVQVDRQEDVVRRRGGAAPRRAARSARRCGPAARTRAAAPAAARGRPARRRRRRRR